MPILFHSFSAKNFLQVCSGIKCIYLYEWNRVLFLTFRICILFENIVQVSKNIETCFQHSEVSDRLHV